MSMELLRLGLQFFAGETKEEEDKVIIPGEEGVPGASGVTGSTPPAYTMPENLVSAPKAQDFDTWYKANGGMDEAGYYAKYDLDPERDYQNTVNTLNYEYQTSMATYGENAEKMYQMGLQNSGVSDIFQANAFSSYLGNMNQAAADRITARKKNKAAFNDYVAGMRAQHGQYETGIKTEYDTKLNSALTYAMSKYNGYNLQDVLNELGVSGYYAEIVDKVGKRLSGMDATSLQATTETVLAQDIINNISGFTGSENDLAAAISMYKGMYGEDVIGKAFERAKTIYQNSAEGQDQMLKDLVTSGQASFDPNYSYIPTDENGEQILDENLNAIELGGDGGEGSMNAFIKNVWGIETDPNAEGFDQSAYNRAVKAWEQMKVQWDSDVGTAESFIFKNYAQGEEWINAQLSGQFSESVINKAWENFLLSNEGKQWQGTLSQASVDELVNTWTESFDPNMSKEEFVTKMITGEDGKVNKDLRANAEVAWEQMKANWDAKAPERVRAIVDSFGIGEGKIDPSEYSNREEFVAAMVENGYNAEDSGDAWDNFNSVAGKAFDEVWAKYQAVDDTGALINTYTGNTKQKLDIKNLLGADVPEYIYNEVIKRMDANRAEEKEADKQDTLTGIEDLPEDKVNYNTLYNEIQNSGNDPDIRAASSVKLKDAVMGVLNDDSGEKLANAYELIPNMTKDAWNALDGAGKLDALLNGIGEAHKNNVLTADDYNNIVEMWATASLEEADIHNMPDIIQMLNNFADKYGLSNETIDNIIRGANVHVLGIKPNISSSSDMGAIFVDTNKGYVQLRVRRATGLTDTDKQNMVTLFDGNSYQLVRHSGSNILYYLENDKYYELESNEKTEIMFPVNTVTAEIVDTNIVKGSTGYDPIKGTETNKVVLPNGSEYTIPTGYRVEELSTGVIMAVPEDGATRERQPIVLYDPNKS